MYLYLLKNILPLTLYKFHFRSCSLSEIERLISYFLCRVHEEVYRLELIEMCYLILTQSTEFVQS